MGGDPGAGELPDTLGCLSMQPADTLLASRLSPQQLSCRHPTRAPTARTDMALTLGTSGQTCYTVFVRLSAEVPFSRSTQAVTGYR